ncbi:hypothetical protein HPB51_015155 [Rhipicephalus microplus]|uniref:Tick transposon n=1 Tax=Rhipicephalus microplus TaxID=6941 RepID=A0A9J6DNS6_RHIMP|nr:hypothetical protein HPB51_015155 [Rhipicephalus microplus]
MISSRILNSSKVPKLPEGDVRVIIRPRDGLNIRSTRPALLDEAIYEAAGLTRDDRLTICPNLTQNIVVVSTPESATAERLRRIKEIQIEERMHATAPDETAKGIIRNVSLKYTQEYLLKALVTNRNPSLIHAKRLGSTTTIIFLFDGYKVPTWVYFKSTITRVSLYKKQIDFCREYGRLGHTLDICPHPEEKLCTRCGMRNPTQEQDGKPRCKLCEEDHPTAYRLCRAEFKMPYIVKQRRWAARAEERDSSCPPDSPQPEARPPTKSRETRGPGSDPKKIMIQEQTQGEDACQNQPQKEVHIARGEPAARENYLQNRPQEEVPLARREPAVWEHKQGCEFHNNKESWKAVTQQSLQNCFRYESFILDAKMAVSPGVDSVCDELLPTNDASADLHIAGVSILVGITREGFADADLELCAVFNQAQHQVKRRKKKRLLPRATTIDQPYFMYGRLKANNDELYQINRELESHIPDEEFEEEYDTILEYEDNANSVMSERHSRRCV